MPVVKFSWNKKKIPAKTYSLKMRHNDIYQDRTHLTSIIRNFSFLPESGLKNGTKSTAALKD
jgi:hypothetical protein